MTRSPLDGSLPAIQRPVSPNSIIATRNMPRAPSCDPGQTPSVGPLPLPPQNPAPSRLRPCRTSGGAAPNVCFAPKAVDEVGPPLA